MRVKSVSASSSFEPAAALLRVTHRGRSRLLPHFVHLIVRIRLRQRICLVGDVWVRGLLRSAHGGRPRVRHQRTSGGCATTEGGATPTTSGVLQKELVPVGVVNLAYAVAVPAALHSTPLVCVRVRSSTRRVRRSSVSRPGRHVVSRKAKDTKGMYRSIDPTGTGIDTRRLSQASLQPASMKL